MPDGVFKMVRANSKFQISVVRLVDYYFYGGMGVYRATGKPCVPIALCMLRVVYCIAVAALPEEHSASRRCVLGMHPPPAIRSLAYWDGSQIC